MSERDKQFMALYQQWRFKGQQDWYKSRRTEFETAHSQAMTLSTVLMFLTSLMATLAAANIGGWTHVWALLAIIFPVLSTAISAYNELYAFERQAKLYQDADNALLRARAEAPDLKPELTGIEYQRVLAAYVDHVENVFRTEQGQWGQLVNQLKSAEQPADAQIRDGAKDDGTAVPPVGSEKAAGT
jgi:hypothetical protein